MPKQKFYAVWEGHKKGVFSSWTECKKQIDGYTGAKYKSFESQEEATKALSNSYYKYINKKSEPKKANSNAAPPVKDSIVVDAAWNTKTGDMEYQGVDFKTGKLLFKKGPYQDGTNNVGEFLAIVHALALLKKYNSALPIYTDSKTAMSWVKKKIANTKLNKTAHNQELFDMLQRAEEWLHKNTFSNPILKWETKSWGENPADFGRK